MTNERLLREWQVFLGEKLGCKFDDEGKTHCDKGETCPYKIRCVEDDFQAAWHRRIREIEEQDQDLRANLGISQEWKDAVYIAVKSLDHIYFHGNCRSCLPTTESLLTRLAELVGLMYWEYSCHSLEYIARKYDCTEPRHQDVLDYAIAGILAKDYPGWYLDRPEDLHLIGSYLANVIKLLYAVNYED